MEIKCSKTWYFSIIQQIVTLLSNSGSYSHSLWKCSKRCLKRKGFPATNQCYTDDDISTRVPFCSSFPGLCQAEVLVAWQTGHCRQNPSCHCRFSRPDQSLPAAAWKVVGSLCAGVLLLSRGRRCLFLIFTFKLSSSTFGMWIQLHKSVVFL